MQKGEVGEDEQKHLFSVFNSFISGNMWTHQNGSTSWRGGELSAARGYRRGNTVELEQQ